MKVTSEWSSQLYFFSQKIKNFVHIMVFKSYNHILGCKITSTCNKCEELKIMFPINNPHHALEHGLAFHSDNEKGNFMLANPGQGILEIINKFAKISFSLNTNTLSFCISKFHFCYSSKLLKVSSSLSHNNHICKSWLKIALLSV